MLLQNRDQLLPLDKSKLKRIAVLGPLADRLVLNNYNGKPDTIVTALQGIRDRAGAAIEVLHDEGCDVTGGGTVAMKIDKEEGFSGGASVKLDAHAAGEFIEFQVAVNEAGEYEVRLEYKSFPSRGIYQLSIDGQPQGQPVDMHDTKGDYRQTASLGTKQLNAAKHMLRFTVTGKNAASTGFSGHFDKLTLIGKNALSFECETLKPTTGGGREVNSIEHATELARGADVAIVCVGTDVRVEHEGRDRKTLGLTGARKNW